MLKIFKRTRNTYMNYEIVHSTHLLGRDQYTRHNILKVTIKVIDNERLKQIPYC